MECAFSIPEAAGTFIFMAAACLHRYFSTLAACSAALSAVRVSVSSGAFHRLPFPSYWVSQLDRLNTRMPVCTPSISMTNRLIPQRVSFCSKPSRVSYILVLKYPASSLFFFILILTLGFLNLPFFIPQCPVSFLSLPRCLFTMPFLRPPRKLLSFVQASEHPPSSVTSTTHVMPYYISG